jgi:hypothetical protein
MNKILLTITVIIVLLLGFLTLTNVTNDFDNECFTRSSVYISNHTSTQIHQIGDYCFGFDSNPYSSDKTLKIVKISEHRRIR